MKQPQGFIDHTKPSYVCYLKKAIYGLKQVPRAWYNELKSFLIYYGFKNSYAYTFLFIYKKNDLLMYILVYVDDNVYTGNNN